MIQKSNSETVLERASKLFNINQQASTTQHQLFQPPHLPYSYNALHLISDSKNTQQHFVNYHLNSYDALLEELSAIDTEVETIQQLFSSEELESKKIIDYAGSVVNHQLFWENLSIHGGEISTKLNAHIEREFGSLFKLKDAIKEAAIHLGCCGWVWLVKTDSNDLKIEVTKENVNPFCCANNENITPILVIDLWVHAYSSKFGDDKNQYLDNIWPLINWSEVSRRYQKK